MALLGTITNCSTRAGSISESYPGAGGNDGSSRIFFIDPWKYALYYC